VVEIDTLDRQIIHALQLDGRLPFSRIGEVVGVSDQTVARRYRRLRSTGMLRVVGKPDWRLLGQSWMVRLRCAPDAALPVATALARRPDTTWVRLTSGGTEIMCGLVADELADGGEVLLSRLGRTGRVLSVSAHCVLHMFVGGATSWAPLTTALDPDQADRLRPAPPPSGSRPVALNDGDRALFELLGRDARTGLAELAAATGWSESTTRRRIDALLASGSLYYDLDVDERLFGSTLQAWLWMSVPPAALDRVGRALAEHHEVAYAAATTGPTNLVSSVLATDPEDLYRYLTVRVGALDGVRHLESAPIVRVLKRSGTLLV
jgi:DNA-binding Lrp family transcriptional regulator